MEKVKWSDLSSEIQARREVNWSELPWNVDLDTVPVGVTIKALTGEAAAESARRFDEACAAIAEKMGPLTEDEVSQIANDRS